MSTIQQLQECCQELSVALRDALRYCISFSLHQEGINLSTARLDEAIAKAKPDSEIGRLNIILKVHGDLSGYNSAPPAKE